MRMNLFLFGLLTLKLLSSCNDPIMEENALNAGIVSEQDLKSQSAVDKSIHPRLLLTDSSLTVLKSQAVSDPVLQKYVTTVISTADSYLNSPTLTHTLSDGVRMLDVCEECKRQMQYLCLAYRWTGNEKYALAAKKQLLAVSGFPDWNPSHFMDVAEMTNAVAFGYDWLYNWLDQSSRTTIQNAIYNFGLLPYLNLYYNSPNHTGIRGNSNWNCELNGSAIMGSLAVADLYPEKAQEVMQVAVKHLPTALKMYAPDGIWFEGFDYWTRATEFACYGIQALNTAVGSDFGLSSIYGFSNAGYTRIYLTSPANYFFNFSDARSYGSKDVIVNPELLFLGKRFNNPSFINEEHRRIKNSKATAMDVVYYTPAQASSETKELDRFFNGSTPVFTLRSVWNDANAFWVASKGGNTYADRGHAHLDLGTFNLEANGIIWAADLGRDNYNIDGYWDSGVNGKRWTIYRLNSHSHNVPMINNKDQLVTGNAIVKSYSLNVNEPYLIYDLTSAYSEDASSVLRELKLINNRKALEVTDKINLKAQSDIYWGMTTPATIQILANGEALLSKDGKQLTAKIVSPSGLNFYSESCTQSSPQNANAGFSRLMVKANRPAGEVILKITLTPKY